MRVVFDLAVPPGVELAFEPPTFATGDLAGEHRTACGWPYRLDVHADAIVARYRFLDRDAVVHARGPRDAVLAVLAAARPDWRDTDVIALVQLWETT